jgi:hypothetical protein
VDVQMDEIGQGRPIYRGGPTAQPAGILTTCWTIPPSMM